MAVSAELVCNKSFTGKVLPLFVGNTGVWLRDCIHIRTAEILCHLFMKNSSLTADTESQAFPYACVRSTAVQRRAVQVVLACHSKFYTAPRENSCMSFFKIRTSKMSVSSSGAWQAVRPMNSSCVFLGRCCLEPLTQL